MWDFEEFLSIKNRWVEPFDDVLSFDNYAWDFKICIFLYFFDMYMGIFLSLTFCYVLYFKTSLNNIIKLSFSTFSNMNDTLNILSLLIVELPPLHVDIYCDVIDFLGETHFSEKYDVTIANT